MSDSVHKSKPDEPLSTFDRTERRLNEWGAACRENSNALGLPTISGIARMIDHVRAQDLEEKEVRKQALRKSRKAWKEGDDATDSKLVAEELGYAEKDLTAKGKENRVYQELHLQICSNDMQIDFTVAKLNSWMKIAIIRSYCYGQPDRNVAQDLRIPKGTYRLRRIAAVEHLAELLSIAESLRNRD